MASHTFLLVGLGNTGAQYAATRHNIGRNVLFDMLKKYDVPVKKFKNYGKIAWFVHDAGQTAIYFPDCYMNVSGESVGQCMRYYGIDACDICVFHDDLEKKVGKWYVKQGGSARGHNGIKNIIAHVGQDFWRVGVGIGHPSKEGRDVADYVLSVPSAEEGVVLAAVYTAIQAEDTAWMQGQFAAVAKRK